MVTRFLITAALAIGMAHCTITEMPLSHDNPMDRIFDSGSYRLVLTGSATSSTSSTLNWAPIFYKDSSGSVTELGPTDITGSAQLLFTAAAPSASDIAIVKQAGTLTGYSAISCSITLGNAGSCVATLAPYKGYYIISASYNYNGEAGKLYSNFVAVQ